MMPQNRYEQNRIVEEIFSGWVCACVYVSVNFQIITQSQASNMGSNFQFEICVWILSVGAHYNYRYKREMSFML